MDDRHADKRRARQEQRLDQALKGTFPASDPVAISQVDAPSAPKPSGPDPVNP